MVKYLSKHKQKVIAVVGVLLLIVFLAPSAITQFTRMGASKGTVWANTASGKSITLGELEEVRGQLRVLDEMRPLGQMRGNGSAVLMWLARPDNELKAPELWWLLTSEAKDAGLVGGQADGRAFINDIAALGGVTGDQMVMALAAKAQVQPSEVLLTIANLAGVERLMTLVAEAPRAGEARQRLTARELLTSVSADIVPISASSVGEAVAVEEPTLSALEKQFQAGRDHLPGTGPAGAGYKQDNRVSIEWLAVPLQEIKLTVRTDPALDPVELRKEFMKNPAAYAPPTPPGAVPVIPKFEDVKDKVTETVTQRLVNERWEKIAAFIRDWSRKGMKDVPETGGHYTLPADWEQKKPSFAELAKELHNKFGLQQLPRLNNSGPKALTVSEVEGNQFFLAGSVTKEYGAPITLGKLVAQIKEFDPQSRLPLQKGVIGPILSTRGNDLVAYRVTLAEPAAPPASMSDVSAAVMSDATTALRYEELVRQQAAIKEKAEKNGMAALANEYSTVVDVAPQISMASAIALMRGMPPMPSPLSRAGSDADAVRAVLARAVTLPTDKPISTLPESERILTIPVPNKLLLLVVRINDVKPVSLEDWNTLSSNGVIARAQYMKEPGLNMINLFGLEQVRARHGFKLVNPDGPDRAQLPDLPQF